MNIVSIIILVSAFVVTHVANAFGIFELGPFLAKVNPLWPLYQYLTGVRHKKFKHLHQKYGDIVRIGINELSVCNVEALEAIYGHGSHFLKTASYRAIPNELKYSTVFSETDPIVHNMLKKQLASAFSTKALDSMQVYIRANINTFCDCIRKFGKNGELALIMVCPALLPLHYLSPKHIKEAHMQLINQSTEMINERIENKSDRNDFFYYLSDSERLKKAPQDFRDRLVSTCVVLIVAGGETTSIVLNGAIYLLAAHNNVYEKLHRELTERFPDPKCEIEHHKLADLPYLNAVIDESMRLHPPIVGPLPRVSSQETVVAAQKIPPHCIVSVAPYAISRDPRYFTKPENFIPERWIDSGFERDQTLGKLVFQPFSLGPRRCLGRNMAYIEIRLFLANFVLQFRPELEDPKYHYGVQDRVLSFKPSVMVKCRPLKEDSA
ncbi:Isotrichodermin C-15 hydroxylase [Neolecta irregularis DAH-3]|uniref:Isotrichodermin C-15 hydroxylase n=1 Tax=Neolecta irregularis (strain DAH-3) TaxID=1198029 RepID=A0A1U7LRM3_NEOID|nr:Isotrichodermin C-15 hydroxylase [Neolecta irregularis DAH-3]|eukprot:OLL25307.1 Isotrichodermin C-15 hydroxylase [Neolecta irregularis DAH-3]